MVKLGRTALLTALVLVLAAPAWGSVPSIFGDGDKIPYDLEQALTKPLQKKAGELADQKDDKGRSYKRGNFSKRFKTVDEETYLAAFHVRTATEDRLLTERLALTLKKNASGEWEIVNEEVKDSWDGMRRTAEDYEYHNFDSLKFEREGVTVTGGSGSLYTSFFDGKVQGFVAFADNLDYDYEPPEDVPTGYYHAIHRINMERYKNYWNFDPERISFYCDADSCEDLLASIFSGLRKVDKSEVRSDLGRKATESLDKMSKDRKDDAFSGFRRAPEPGNRFWWATIWKNDKHRIWMQYDNWDPEEVAVGFTIEELTGGYSIPQTVYSYYSEETRQAMREGKEGYSQYDLARRDDEGSRYHEVVSVRGDLELALDDPELLHGDMLFGLRVKRDLKELPFFIQTIKRGEGEEARNPTLSVDAVEMNGEPLTVVRTGSASGLIVFPEEIPGGSQIELRMSFGTRAIYKVNHAFSQMYRGGWLPFVRFADMIDKTEMVITAPAEYKVLGIGQKVEEVQSEHEGKKVSVTRWVADNPVAFPTVIFGKYEEGKPSFEAKKADGTVIPVTVHVDEVSMGTLDISVDTYESATDQIDELSSGSRGIRGKQLIPIAEQAVNSINLYREMSGLDYPYGELNLVNDPAPAMYGQAPSSIIYLGSTVFRGEGTMAAGGLFSGRVTEGRGGGGTGTAKFLKSVVAHEVGHQWWGSRISNANNRNYWFVETLAEYFSAVWLEAVHGKKEYQEQVDEWRRRILQIEQFASVQKATTDFGGEFPGAAYQALVYNKGPYAFHMLRETFGDEKFFPALKQMSMELAAKREIVTEDIQMALESALGGVDQNGNRYNVDLGWFFDQWIRGIGIPEYSFNFTTRQTEDGGYLIEGVIKQRVVAGQENRKYVLEGQYYRGVVPITVVAKKGQEFVKRLVVEGPETPFRLKVAEKPLEVVLNKNGEILAHEVQVNRPF